MTKSKTTQVLTLITASWVLISIRFAHLDLGFLYPSSKQILSSSFRLDGKCLWIAIVRSLHRSSVGLKSGLWQGHWRTVRDFSFTVCKKQRGLKTFWYMVCGWTCRHFNTSRKFTQKPCSSSQTTRTSRRPSKIWTWLPHDNWVRSD